MTELEAPNETDRQSAKRSILLEIDISRTKLSDNHRNLGPWEEDLLGQAETAVNERDWLNLAVACIYHAHQVHRLPPAEYDHGFNYNKR